MIALSVLRRGSEARLLSMTSYARRQQSFSTRWTSSHTMNSPQMQSTVCGISANSHNESRTLTVHAQGGSRRGGGLGWLGSVYRMGRERESAPSVEDETADLETTLGITEKAQAFRHHINIREHCFNTRDLAARSLSSALALTFLHPVPFP